jgi:hypothetical protein
MGNRTESLVLNNLFITYDLDKPGQDYKKIEDAVKSLGLWGHFQQSVWWVHTAYSEVQVRDFLRGKIDSNDRLLVVNASSGGAAWYNSMCDSQFVNGHWSDAA